MLKKNEYYKTVFKFTPPHKSGLDVIETDTVYSKTKKEAEQILRDSWDITRVQKKYKKISCEIVELYKEELDTRLAKPKLGAPKTEDCDD